METVTKEQVLEELECMIDPELGVDSANFGLVCDVTFEKQQHGKLTMTMKSMGCLLVGHIIAEVKEILQQVSKLKKWTSFGHQHGRSYVTIAPLAYMPNREEREYTCLFTKH